MAASKNMSKAKKQQKAVVVEEEDPNVESSGNTISFDKENENPFYQDIDLLQDHGIVSFKNRWCQKDIWENAYVKVGRTDV